MQRFFASACTAAALAFTPAAHAQDWEYSFTPYLWFSSLDLKTGAPGLPVTEVQQDFGDIFDDLQLGFMGKFEARRGQLFFMADAIYVDTGASATPSTADVFSAHIDSETTLLSGAAGYRVIDHGYSIDVFSGLRTTWATTDVGLTLTNGDVIKGGTDEEWTNAYVGMRGNFPLSERWSLTGIADMGGGQSDFTWQAAAIANYRFDNGMLLNMGYRAYGDDFDDDGFVYNVVQDGLLLGATFPF